MNLKNEYFPCLENLKQFSIDELALLAFDIRKEIIQVMSKNGGHLASNLGMVELTIALHYVFNSPQDLFIFDVSHQAYTHKILTGRKDRFHTIRKHQGLSGFTSPKESQHDHFFAGHAGTALSLALGCAKARDLSNEVHHVIPIIGDASLTCGLTLEALNNIPTHLERFIVILNDNKMSISENVGAITEILGRLINHPKSNRFYRGLKNQISKIPNFGQILAHGGSKIKKSIKTLFSSAPFFEQFNLAYVGIIDGHNLKQLIELLEQLKHEPKSILLHVSTIKGYGMDQAISNPASYHGVKPFDIETGVFVQGSSAQTFPQVFGEKIHIMAKNDPNIVVITPAMPQGSCIDKAMVELKDQFIDVGIAEGHALTFAGGIALDRRKKVIVSIYSTFLQRALDNLFHDICLQESPVVLAIDRAGISPADGSTHHGIYDLGFLNSMPNLVIAQPRSKAILNQLLEKAFEWKKPTAIRYPNLPADTTPSNGEIEFGKGEIVQFGADILIIFLGHCQQLAQSISDRLKQDLHLSPTLFDPIFIKPLDSTTLLELIHTHQIIVTIEEHSLKSGLGTIVDQFIIEKKIEGKTVLNFGLPDFFIEHGSYLLLLEEAGLSQQTIFNTIKKSLRG